MGLQDPRYERGGGMALSETSEYLPRALGHKIPHLCSVISRQLALVAQSVLNTSKCTST